jgi:hypothetical protein
MAKLTIIMNDEERHTICVEKIIAIRLAHKGLFKKRLYVYNPSMCAIIPFYYQLPINLKFTVQQ